MNFYSVILGKREGNEPVLKIQSYYNAQNKVGLAVLASSVKTKVPLEPLA